MRKVARVIGLAAIFPFPAFAENQMLDGTYKLLSATRKIVETGEVVDSYGKHPTGYIHYGKDGRFLVLRRRLPAVHGISEQNVPGRIAEDA